MEANGRWVAVTAVAPIAWGTNYYVTRHFLPSAYPLYGAALRALPAGVLLLAIARARPHGSWWWKSALLGVLNVGAFFVLVYLSAQLLPSSVASPLMALSAGVMMLLAWAVLAERPRALPLLGAVAGFGGVCLMLWADAGEVDPYGVLAAGAAMVMSSVGYILTKRWIGDLSVLAVTSWQLIAGGVLLAPIAIGAEGGFPELGARAMLGFAYVTVVATAAAFAAWFAGLRRLDAATVGLVGLLNPVAAVLLGTVVAGEPFGPRQMTGLAVVLAGVALGQHRRHTSARASAEIASADSGTTAAYTLSVECRHERATHPARPVGTGAEPRI
jgi:probable blue pigment (indigoidine) exporter